MSSLKIKTEVLQGLEGEALQEALRAVEELSADAAENPLSLYFPHPRQRIFHRFTAPIKVFLGGNQSGKTHGGLADDLIQALPRSAVPEHLLSYKQFDPPFKCRIMSESYSVLETVLYDKLRELLPERELLGKSWQTAYNTHTKVLTFECGSSFHFATYEQDPKKLAGATLDRVHYDEEPPLEHRNEGKIRVMRREGQEIFTMTPTEGLTWTYDVLWEKRGKETADRVFRSGDVDLLLVDMDENEALTTNAKRLALEGYSDEEREARKTGRFVAIHGLIYGDFRRERHVIPELDFLPQNVNVIVGIDPGIRTRCAVVWCYLAPGDEMVVFDEGYYQGLTIGEVCAEIELRNTYWEAKPAMYVMDPAGRNIASQTGRSDQMEFADHGIVAISGQNSVTAGINRVRERLQREEGLLIGANCRNLISELGKYRWKKPPRTGEDGKQEPVKRDDHLLDALRYVIASRPYAPEEEKSDDLTPLQRAMKEDRDRGDTRKAAYTSVGQSR